MKQVIAGSARAKLAEKLRSRQVAAQERAARARTSAWAEAVDKLRRKQAALKEQAQSQAAHSLTNQCGLQHFQDSQTPSTAPNDPTAPESAWRCAVAKVRARTE